jgi:hypothetical protein
LKDNFIYYIVLLATSNLSAQANNSFANLILHLHLSASHSFFIFNDSFSKKSAKILVSKFHILFTNSALSILIPLISVVCFISGKSLLT